MITKSKTFKVEGMTCSGCERTVQKVIGNIEGVKNASANVATASVSVEYDPARVNTDQIRDAVSKVGYRFEGELE